MPSIAERRLAGRRLLAAILLIGCAAFLTISPALALSEIPNEEVETPPATDDKIESQPLPPVPDTPSDPAAPPGSETPPPTESPPPQNDTPTPPAEEQPVEPPADGTPPATEGEEEAQPQPPGPPAEIIYDLSRLPQPAKRMRELIIEAARTGDLEKLRPFIGTGESATILSFGGVDGDPIEFLRSISGDTEPGEGQEILAILEEVLSAGFVHVEAGTPEEMYVWPYFYGVPLEGLTPPQRVELFKIVTAGDYEEMRAFGAYSFYRAGITPEGKWQFFVAGD
jgi:hypothetical protein